MDDQLQRLARELRRESCPPEVMHRVARYISQEKAGMRFRQVWAWGAPLIALLVALGAWQRHAGLNAQKNAAELQAKAHADRARIAEQTAGALRYVGHVLLQAAAHSEDSLLKKAMPALRDGLQTTKNKVIDRI